jgi:hypothetical protein
VQFGCWELLGQHITIWIAEFPGRGSPIRHSRSREQLVYLLCGSCVADEGHERTLRSISRPDLDSTPQPPSPLHLFFFSHHQRVLPTTSTPGFCRVITPFHLQRPFLTLSNTLPACRSSFTKTYRHYVSCSLHTCLDGSLSLFAYTYCRFLAYAMPYPLWFGPN